MIRNQKIKTKNKDTLFLKTREEKTNKLEIGSKRKDYFNQNIIYFYSLLKKRKG